jgi:hypothetical protein
MLTSTYSSEFTKQSPLFTRNGTSSGNFYYEVINITVPAQGSYIFQCESNIDTFAYMYNQTFNPLNPAANLFKAFDDENYERWEFSISMFFLFPETFPLVVTTYNPNVKGPFFIVGSGNNKVTFNRIVSTVQPTTTTSTTTKTTTTNTTSTTTKPTTSTTSTTTKLTTTTTSTTTKTTTNSE